MRNAAFAFLKKSKRPLLMQEYRQSQKEKWEKEKSSPTQRREGARSKSPSKPKTPEKDKTTAEKQKTRGTTPPAPKPRPNSSKAHETIISTPKNTKILQGETMIHEAVKSWQSSYLYSIKHTETLAETEKYVTVWSKPTATIPIPEFTANIYFTFHTNKKQQILSYTIEGNKFLHSVDDGFREEWIDAVIEGKRAAQEALYTIKL